MKPGSNHSQPQGQENNPGYHRPVMLKEVIEGLAIRPDGIYVDCTLGGGGHSRAILEKLGANGRLIAFDQDADAAKNLPADKRFLFIPENFRHLGRFLRLHKIDQVQGILADLGVSSYQIDTAQRGFSTRFEGPLDMRMDKRMDRTAADLLEDLSETELHKMFEQYGEVTNAKTLAKAIVSARRSAPLKTINQFRHALQHVVKGHPSKYWAQVFQALRIMVNDELGALQEMLSQTPSHLSPGGRIAVITFHSLEDRIVKNYFKTGTTGSPVEDPVFGKKPESPFEILTRKPILPSAEEISQNPRARSARLRIAIKK